jgi:probable HAF family extracellular repeat protein
VQFRLPDGSETGYVTGIAGDQRVTGTWLDATARNYHCYTWTPAGGSVDIGLMGNGRECQAAAINSSGRVAGGAQVTIKGPLHAFLYDDGVRRNLGLLEGDAMSYASALNERGHAVGWSSASTTDADTSRAFFWSGGTMKELAHGAPFAWTSAYGINNRDEIVGQAWNAVSDRAQAVLFGKDGQVVALDTQVVEPLGDWKLMSAYSINDKGAIVDWGDRADGFHGFMLVPVEAR